MGMIQCKPVHRDWHPKALKLSGVLLVLGTLLILGSLSGRPVYADPPPDVPCRGCHGDNQRQLTLPSGELLPLLVDLERLDASPHNHAGATPVSCTGCHQGPTWYRYPHPPTPAQSRRDYTALVAQSCERCHYPHNPFHEVAGGGESGQEQAVGEEAPTCVDCHGSHTIDWVAQITEQMPTNCVRCHTDQDESWAVDLIGPRPGVGEGAPGYVGSSRCLGCHADKYLTWRDTLHAKMIQDPEKTPGAVVGDFNQEDPNRTFSLADVVYTIGSRWKQRYITQTLEGDFYILPAQWNVETGEWASYHADDWQDREWRQSCGSCHVTGLETETWTFTEFSIGCEGCHGPGEEHAKDPVSVKPFARSDDQLCGSCHSRGTSPEGYAFPADYRPGDFLGERFTFTTDEAALWPDGSARKHHQQYMDWTLGNRMEQQGVTCTTCHLVHEQGTGPSQLQAATANDLCRQCHNQPGGLVAHTPYHKQAMQEYDFSCVDCHMPEMATSAVPFDIHSHTLQQPNPQASLEAGGVEKMPNACNLCHTDYGEDPEWALETIAYAKEISPQAASFFRPGPTPTPPPPPTPLPSVGRPAEHVQVSTFGWVRTTALVVFALAIVGIFVVIVVALRNRRASHA